MPQLFANNASTVLNGAINSITTTIVVADGSAFPAPSGGDFFAATLVGTDVNGNENAWEIVTVTARSGNTLTVVRGQEGTAAASWANGARIELRMTAGAIDEIISLIDKKPDRAGLRNYIINGDMRIAQRGSSFSIASPATLPYTLDRWAFWAPVGTVSAQVERVAVGSNGFQHGIRVRRNAGNTNTFTHAILQSLESANSRSLQGKTVTLSFYVAVGANFGAAGGALNFNVATGTGTDQSVVGIFSGSWTGWVTNNFTINPTTTLTRYTRTVTIPANATQIGVGFWFVGSGTAGADDSFTITGVQLEEGPVATPFEQRPIGMELGLCQRYYFRTSGSGARFGSGFNATTTTAQHVITFPVEMRVAPTTLEQSGTPGDYRLYQQNTTTALSAVPVIGSCSTTLGAVSCTVASGLNAGGGSLLSATNANAYLGFSAEL